MERCDVTVIGSGFAGTILARIVHGLELRVVLLDRSRHPRFASGESSMPLAALCLERLANRFGLLDLDHLSLLFAEAARDDGVSKVTFGRGLERYGRLLERESRQMSSLLRAAYRALTDFELFVA